MSTLEQEIQTLSNTLVYELTKALALPQTERVKSIVRMLFGRAARKFSELAVGLDRVVAEHGIAAGARWVLPRFVKDHAARGLENIPPTGPLVIAANHPGAYDSVVISAHVTRPDYKVIIGDIPFFENLPHVSEHAIYAPALQNTYGRMQVIRESIRHLQGGGALLIFARGGIEPDPALMPAPDAEFNLWSRSLQIFLERVPQTRVLVTIVGGVIASKMWRHPITWFRKARPDRQRLAFMMQIAQQVLSGKEKFGLTPRVSFGELIGLHETSNAEDALHRVIESARRLVRSHLAWEV
ncbi:MAG: 1-acyl-sn-glycerol-3-phosphate acyltransferase [Chloroflexota bacterium]